jgi:hypothetical protein
MPTRWRPSSIGQQIRFEHLNAIHRIKSVGLPAKLTPGLYCALFGQDTIYFFFPQHAQYIGNFKA